MLKKLMTLEARVYRLFGGNRGEFIFSGVRFSRDPKTGQENITAHWRNGAEEQVEIVPPEIYADL